MKSVTFTKKQIKRVIAIALFVVVAVAVGITLAATSVGSRAAKRLLPI